MKVYRIMKENLIEISNIHQVITIILHQNRLTLCLHAWLFVNYFLMNVQRGWRSHATSCGCSSSKLEKIVACVQIVFAEILAKVFFPRLSPPMKWSLVLGWIVLGKLACTRDSIWVEKYIYIYTSFFPFNKICKVETREIKRNESRNPSPLDSWNGK